MNKLDCEIKLLTSCQTYIPALAKPWYHPTIPNWYVQLEWTDIGNDELFGHHVAVMSLNL